jgi:hypothetical protein
MIDKQEIDAKAEELGMHAANVRCDYVFGWLWAGLALFMTAPPTPSRIEVCDANRTGC